MIETTHLVLTLPLTLTLTLNPADVGLDPSMAAMQLRRGLLTPAWLQSVAAALGVSTAHTVVIGASELPLNVRPLNVTPCATRIFMAHVFCAAAGQCLDQCFGLMTSQCCLQICVQLCLRLAGGRPSPCHPACCHPSDHFAVLTAVVSMTPRVMPRVFAGREERRDGSHRLAVQPVFADDAAGRRGRVLRGRLRCRRRAHLEPGHCNTGQTRRSTGAVVGHGAYCG